MYAGDLELLYIAKNDSDAFACAALAEDVARYINSLTTHSTGRRRQAATSSSSMDPIFNYMMIASPLEQEMHNGTAGDDGGGTAASNSGAVFFSIPCTLMVFTLPLLLKLTME